MDSTEYGRPILLELRWEGPFRWPGLRCHGDLIPLDAVTTGSSCGVYLWTIEYCGGFLIYATGITRRPFVNRLGEHTRAYRSGVYTVFDVPSLKQGVRKKIWPGFWFGERSPVQQDEYDRRREQIAAAAEELLLNYRVFVAAVDPIARVLERIEAAIMNALYAAAAPASVIPDRGMSLAPRWPEERPISVRSIAPVLLHGLPAEFEA